jgi:hypothetical protein
MVRNEAVCFSLAALNVCVRLRNTEYQYIIYCGTGGISFGDFACSILTGKEGGSYNPD